MAKVAMRKKMKKKGKKWRKRRGRKRKTVTAMRMAMMLTTKDESDGYEVVANLAMMTNADAVYM
jgi:hypothetical protein